MYHQFINTHNGLDIKTHELININKIQISNQYNTFFYPHYNANIFITM